MQTYRITRSVHNEHTVMNGGPIIMVLTAFLSFQLSYVIHPPQIDNL